MQSAKFIVQAHRGVCSTHMENSLPAFSEALRLGVHGIELDVHLTADERIVVVHDELLLPEVIADAAGKPIKKSLEVTATSLQELQKLRLSLSRRLNVKRKLTDDEMKIPSLTEVMELVGRERAPSFGWLDIEMKVPDSQRGNVTFRQKYLQAFLREVSPFRPNLPMVVRSFDWELLASFRSLDAEFRLGILSEAGSVPDRATLEKVRPFLCAPCLKNLEKATVTFLRGQGALVLPWTVNDEAGLRRCLELGVDGLTSDDPALIYKLLGGESF